MEQRSGDSAKSEAGPALSKQANVKPPNIASVPVPGGKGAQDSVELLEKARPEADTVLKELGSQLSGQGQEEADFRLKQVGMNEMAPGEAAIGADAPLVQREESVGPPRAMLRGTICKSMVSTYVPQKK
jgi:hypothetical protein